MRSLSHLSEIDLAKIRRFAEARIPPHTRHQVRLDIEVQGHVVTIIERRAPWSPTIGPEWTSAPIAQLRFNRVARVWHLYWLDSNLRWHRYDGLDAATYVDPLLAEIEADPQARFWG